MDTFTTELWSYIEKFQVFLPKLIFAVLALTVWLFVARTTRRRVVKYIRSKAEDKLLINFIDDIVAIINGVIGILLFLQIIGQADIAKGILGAAGVSAFIIGFAFKDIGENFLAGVLMAFKRPFRIGDTIKSGDIEGVITEMSLRDTHIKTFDGKDVYIPNGQIVKNPLYNYTIDGFMRRSITFDLALDVDIDQARALALNVLKNIPGILQDNKPPFTMATDVNDNKIKLVAYYWINTFSKEHPTVEIHTKAIKNILSEFHKANIPISPPVTYSQV